MNETFPQILVAGTGYGVGKSVVLRAIAAYQAATGSPWAQLSLTQASPSQMDLAENWRSLQSQKAALPQHSGLLIEAVGSLGTPVTPESTLADLAWDWRLPTLLVTAVTPHCLDDLVAHVALAKQARCDVRGIVLNCTTPTAEENRLDWAPPQQVAALSQRPVLGTVPYLADLAENAMAENSTAENSTTENSTAESDSRFAQAGANLNLSDFGILAPSSLSA